MSKSPFDGLTRQLLKDWSSINVVRKLHVLFLSPAPDKNDPIDDTLLCGYGILTSDIWFTVLYSR